MNIGVRLREPGYAPCPWASPTGGMGSHPEPWDVGAAREFVAEHEGFAVYALRGAFVKRLEPDPAERWEPTGGVRFRF